MRFASIDAWKEEWPVEFLCRIMRVTSRGFRVWRVRLMGQRQRDEMVLLAHIREQYRLSLESHGRPRMTEELQELNLNVGHRRVGRLTGETGIKIIRTQKYKATTDSDHGFNTPLICWIRTSQRMAPTRNGLETSATSGPAKAGCIWPLSLIYILAASSVGPSVTG